VELKTNAISSIVAVCGIRAVGALHPQKFAADDDDDNDLNISPECQTFA
jgi:hypothetical protein